MNAKHEIHAYLIFNTVTIVLSGLARTGMLEERNMSLCSIPLTNNSSYFDWLQRELWVNQPKQWPCSKTIRSREGEDHLEDLLRAALSSVLGEGR